MNRHTNELEMLSPLAGPILADLPAYERDVAAEQIAAPNWGLTRPPGDWKAYIPAAIQGVWGQLSQETQLAAYAIASSLAFREY